MHISEFDSFEAFCRQVHEELPDEWDTKLDEIGLEKTGDERVGFQRDDLFRFMLVKPNEDWPPSKVTLYLPEEIDMICDRPGVPVRHVDTPTVEAVIDFLKEEGVDYQGTFTYDDE